VDAADAADVAVLGAGASGLACARALSAAGVRVAVLEARSSVGGRIRTARMPTGEVIELGAQVVHATHNQSLRRLMSTARIRTAPYAFDFAMYVVEGGKRWDAAGLTRHRSPAPWVVEREIGAGALRSGTLADAVSPLPESRRRLATAWLEQVVGGDCRTLDVAGVMADRESRHPGDELVVVDGFDAVTEDLRRGLDVRLASPVEKVHWSRHGVETDGAALSAGAVVVTVPPSVVLHGGLVFDPPLATGKLAALPSLASTDALAVVLTLAEPARRSVWALLVDEPGGIWWTMSGSQYVVGHVKGTAAAAARARGWTVEHAAQVAATLDPGLGPVTALRLQDWGADPWARGAFSVPIAGIDDASRSWAEPVDGVLFFAGEATADRGLRGLVQGAIASGVRAARQLLDHLGHG
jgi:monoamine oxidase